MASTDIQSNKRWLKILPVLACGLIFSLVFIRPVASQAPPPTTLPTETATLNPIQSTGGLGRIEPKSRVLKLMPPTDTMNARIEKLFIKTGQYIKEGDIVARLDNYTQRQLTLKLRQAELRIAKANLALVKAGMKDGIIQASRAMVAQAEERKKYADTRLERATQLIKKKAVSIEELDQRRWNCAQAQTDLARAKAELAANLEIRAEDVELRTAQVQAAEANVQAAKHALTLSEVRAPFTGRVLQIHTHEGERISNSGIIEFADTKNMQVVAEIFEGDIIRVNPGQSASITMESCNKTFTGIVSEVGFVVGRKLVLINDPVSDTESRIVEVRIDVDVAKNPWIERLSNARVRVKIDLN